MSSAQQGHDFRGYYYHETGDFGKSGSDSTKKPFGANARYNTTEGSNSAVEVFNGFDSRAPIDIIERLFQGRFDISFDYVNPWWLNFIYGPPSTTNNGDGSYTHTWTGEDPQSQRIIIDRPEDGTQRVLQGCVAAQVSMNIQVNGLVGVTISGAYAEERYDNFTSAQPQITEKPLTFADASLNIGAKSYGYVQSGSLNIQNNVEIINEWGTRTGIDYAPRPLTHRFQFSKINENQETTQLEEMYGSSGSQSIQSDVTSEKNGELILDNGVSAGSGINSLTADMDGLFPDTHGEQGLGDPNADVTEEINRPHVSLGFSAVNEVANAL